MIIKKIKKNIFLAVIGLIFLAGCASGHKYLMRPYNSPQSIAVLPFANETTSLDGAVLLRYLVWQELRAKGYDVLDLEETDRILQEQGITDGGQLSAILEDELGKMLSVEALLYGTVKTFKHIMLGFYENRVVEAEFKLVDAKSVALLWNDERDESTKRFRFGALDSVGALAGEIGKQAAVATAKKVLFSSPLRFEAERLINNSFRTLPNRW